MVSGALKGMNDILRKQDSKAKTLAPCPKVVKLYNSGMGRVDPMDQRTVAYLIYNMKHPNKLSLLDFEIVAAKKSNSILSKLERGSTIVETI